MILRSELHLPPDLVAKLQGLPRKVTRKFETTALREASWIIADEARRIARVKSGAMKKGIKPFVTKRRKGFDSVGINVRVGRQGFFVGDLFYAGFIEFGHAIGERSSALKSWQKRTADKRDPGAAVTGDIRRRVPAYPFVGPAFEAKKNEALGFLEGRLIELIREAAK